MTEPKSAADRIAKAPRAWGIKYFDYLVQPDSVFSDKTAAMEESFEQSGASVVPVAIVELKEGE